MEGKERGVTSEMRDSKTQWWILGALVLVISALCSVSFALSSRWAGDITLKVNDHSDRIPRCEEKIASMKEFQVENRRLIAKGFDDVNVKLNELLQRKGER